MMDKAGTASVLAVLSAGFPHVQVSKETARVYHEVLQDLELSEVMKAVRQLLMVSEWFPSAAQIRRTTLELGGRLALSSAEAWGLVMQQVADRGYSRGLNVDDQLVSKAVKTVGWFSICMSDRPDIVRSQFVKVYEELKRQHDTQVLTGGGYEKVRAVEAQQAIASKVAVETEEETNW
jgi:hypothetical protein